jgi:uncharacterized protein (TIGR02391 family)
MQGLLTGDIDIALDTPALSVSQVRAGNIKAYAVTASRRIQIAPEIPTTDEAGLPGFYFSFWHALWAPKGVPRDAVAKLNDAVVKSLADPAVRNRLMELAQDIFPREQQTPEALGAYQKAEIEKWWGGVDVVGRPSVAQARRAFTGHRLAKEALHPNIREDVWALYQREKYDTAVFEAMKAVEVAVRDAASLQPTDIGAPLMRKAFDVTSGKLTDITAVTAEREALSNLFAGAIGAYKNPHSHRNVALDDPDEAAEIILLANHLLRIVDSRKASASKT